MAKFISAESYQIITLFPSYDILPLKTPSPLYISFLIALEKILIEEGEL
jgi:hypothetical protein